MDGMYASAPSRKLLHKMKSLCFVSGQGANHRNTNTMQGCGDDLQHRRGAKGAFFMCSYLRDDTPGGAAASPGRMIGGTMRRVPRPFPSHSRIRQPVQPCRGRFSNQLML